MAVNEANIGSKHYLNSTLRILKNPSFVTLLITYGQRVLLCIRVIDFEPQRLMLIHCNKFIMLWSIMALSKFIYNTYILILMVEFRVTSTIQSCTIFFVFCKVSTQVLTMPLELCWTLSCFIIFQWVLWIFIFWPTEYIWFPRTAKSYKTIKLTATCKGFNAIK